MVARCCCLTETLSGLTLALSRTQWKPQESSQILMRPSWYCPMTRVCQGGWLSTERWSWHQLYYSKKISLPWKNQFTKTNQSSSTTHLPWWWGLPRPSCQSGQPDTGTIHSYTLNRRIHQKHSLTLHQPQSPNLSPDSRPCLRGTDSSRCRTWRRQGLCSCWTQH